VGMGADATQRPLALFPRLHFRRVGGGGWRVGRVGVGIGFMVFEYAASPPIIRCADHATSRGFTIPRRNERAVINCAALDALIAYRASATLYYTQPPFPTLPTPQ